MTRARILSKLGSSPAVFSDGAVVAGITTIDASGVNITGVATATSFSGDGSSLSGVDVAGVSTAGHSVFNTINASGIVTAASFSGSVSFASTSTVPGISTQGHSVFNTINASGIVTANSFSGDGSALTNLPGQKDLWSINATGIHTLSNVGVGTTSATHTLTVGAVGASGTSLFVHGDARIVGVLTVGSSSVTIDGNTNKVQVGTGITLDANTGEIFAPAMKSVGTTGAFYPPVLTTTQRDALTVTEGAMVFNTTSKKMEFYDGTTWQSLPGMSLGLTVALDG